MTNDNNIMCNCILNMGILYMLTATIGFICTLPKYSFCRQTNITVSPITYWEYENCECLLYCNEEKLCDPEQFFNLNERCCTRDVCCFRENDLNCERISYNVCDIKWYRVQEIISEYDIGSYIRKYLMFGEPTLLIDEQHKIRKFECKIGDNDCIQNHRHKKLYFCDDESNKLDNQSQYRKKANIHLIFITMILVPIFIGVFIGACIGVWYILWCVVHFVFFM
jgi:hypothetical protein